MSESKSSGVHVFGVRHLSPAGAWHLRRFLDEIQPEVVLIEGLTDANVVIPDIVRHDSEPPMAILAYTDSLPVRTLVYPFAKYSPEYQALCWAEEHDRKSEFIDLPSDIFLALQDVEVARAKALAEKFRAKAEGDGEPDSGSEEGSAPEDELASGDDNDGETDGAATDADPGRLPSVADEAAQRLAPRVSLYDQYAQIAGEPDYETYWERRFEHNLSDASYRLAAIRFGEGLRELDESTPQWLAENLVREAYMRRRIQETIAAGTRPEKIVAIVGAFHASVLGPDLAPMSDAELARLPRRAAKFTLMPYSYFRLSSQSGYGAGNKAPAYFELMWNCMQRGDLPELPAKYLSLVAREMRRVGTFRSTAEVIEGVRLAETLSALYGGLAPTLRDLHDAATTLIGQGELEPIREALTSVDIGTAIGRLPKGVSKTSIQDDFDREMDRLKLEKYRTAVKQDLTLDLRENRQAKTEASAFLDLNRSSFLHRLRVLDIGFATPAKTKQQSGNWAEKWSVEWTPESEIRLVESVLMGETVELAVAFKFKSILDECKSIGVAAELTSEAIRCGMPGAMDQARAKLQELAVGSSEFVAVAHAASELGMIARYGDVRRFDPEPLIPLIEDLFVQGALSLFATASCDNDHAKLVTVAMDELNRVSLEYHDRVDEPLWIESLRKLAENDSRNPILSGYACALLLERNLMTNEELAREVSRRLSPGSPADLGAGWFEGLSKRNRYALLARQSLWTQLADYVAALDEEEFRRAIVFLRRAFGTFSPGEKRQITENLAEHWGLNKDSTSDLLEKELTESEEKELSELNEFDFGDL